jgi:transposase-like protein
VLEALQSDGTDAEVARAYHIHPVTLSNWKTKLKENGSKAFDSSGDLKEKKDKIAKLERMVGQKEVEIALLKNFLGEPGDLRSPSPPLKKSASWISTRKIADSIGVLRRSTCRRVPLLSTEPNRGPLRGRPEADGARAGHYR